MQLKELAFRKRHLRYQGFTVLEMLITLAAIAIVVLITVPESTIALEKYRLKSANNNLLNGLELARTEAHLRASTVVLCPSSNGHSCRSDGNWNLGWLVYSDGNGDGSVQEIEFIRSFEAPNKEIMITALGAVETAASFTMIGLVRENEAESGLFKICHRNSYNSPKLVQVDSEGFVQVIRHSNEICKNG